MKRTMAYFRFLPHSEIDPQDCCSAVEADRVTLPGEHASFHAHFGKRMHWSRNEDHARASPDAGAKATPTPAAPAQNKASTPQTDHENQTEEIKQTRNSRDFDR